MPYSRHYLGESREPPPARASLRAAVTLLLVWAVGLVVVSAAEGFTAPRVREQFAQPLSGSGAGWGEYCTLTNHCYATLAEAGIGSAAYVKVMTQGDDVPESERGAFVTNELWISFGSHEYWIETGEVSEGCCERRRFYAQAHPGGSPFYLHIDPVPLQINETVTYGIVQCADGSGDWCVIWNGAEAHRFGGWPRRLSEREYGVETAAESMPGSWGRAEGLEGDGASWSAPSLTWWNDGLGAEYCDGQNSERCAGLYVGIGWGFGTGPHDRREGVHSRPRRRRRRFATVPERRGAHVSGRRRVIYNPDGSIDVFIYPRHHADRRLGRRR